MAGSAEHPDLDAAELGAGGFQLGPEQFQFDRFPCQEFFFGLGGDGGCRDPVGKAEVLEDPGVGEETGLARRIEAADGKNRKRRAEFLQGQALKRRNSSTNQRVSAATSGAKVRAPIIAAIAAPASTT